MSDQTLDSVPGGSPSPVRDPWGIRYRELIEWVMREIVCSAVPVQDAVASVVILISPDDRQEFRRRIDSALARFGMHNCARYRISMAEAEQWSMQQRTQ